MMISTPPPSPLLPTSTSSSPKPTLFFRFAPSSSARPCPPATASGHLRLCSGPVFLARALFESKFRVEVVPEPEVAVDVEAELYEFMQRSATPELFPTKEELLAAGRGDLVDSVTRQGGWLALGWDIDDDDDNDDDDERVFQGRFDGGGAAAQAAEEAASSSGRLAELEMESSGIEGILNRLEKERSLSFTVGSIGKDDRDGISLDGTVVGSGVSSQLEPREDMFHDFGDARFQNGSLASINGKINSHKASGWRTWSSQRAGCPDSDFEAGEIIPFDRGNRNSHPSIEKPTDDEKCNTADSASELPSDDKQNFRNHIHSRLQKLEKELSSVLKLVRSGSDSLGSDTSQQSSAEELHKLSDAWEFQQTEMMKTRDKLRSTSAKLAVLEGKMALEIIEAQKVLEEKQKRINDAKKALRLLQTVCIVWANSASEVLLTGSFDGWTSQRKMERSSSGIFFLNLKLYPGRYEIKFIVDGIWMVDPLRQIVHSGGFENNLLLVT